MILIITSLLLLLAKGVRSQSCALLVVNESGDSVDFDEECVAKSKPCIVKCCARDERMKYLGKGDYICTSMDKLKKEMGPSNLPDDVLESYSGIHIMTDTLGNSTKKLVLDFRTLYRKYSYRSEKCPSKQSLDDYGPELDMMEDGRFSSYINSTISPPYYCYDTIFKKGPGGAVRKVYIYVKVYDDTTKTRIIDMYVAYGCLVSAFFLALTLAVYALLKDLHDKFNGLAMMMLIASHISLMVSISGYRFYIMKLQDEGREHELKNVCVWLMPIKLYLTLAAFFWMNGMSFDIWLTFRDVRNHKSSRSCSYRGKLLRYALYAWGSPALLTAFALLMDAYAPDSLIKPRFDLCSASTIERFDSSMIYHHLPMIILITTNMVLYVMTIYNMWMVKKDLANPNFGAAKDKKKNKQFAVYIKLASIMGVYWTIELVQELSKGTESLVGNFILDAPNVLVGVIIFLILVIKKDVIIKLCKRVGIENRWTRRSTHTKSSRTDCYKSRMRSNDDSNELESMNVSNADTVKIGDQTKNPAFQNTRV